MFNLLHKSLPTFNTYFHTVFCYILSNHDIPNIKKKSSLSLLVPPFLNPAVLIVSIILKSLWFALFPGSLSLSLRIFSLCVPAMLVYDPSSSRKKVYSIPHPLPLIFSCPHYNGAWQWEKKICIHVCVTGSLCCTVEKKLCWGK